MAEILTGARARLQLNGVKVGFATGVSVRDTIDYEPVQVLDNLHVESHEPIGYTASMSADRVYLVDKPLKSQGWVPKQGKSSLEHLLNILATGELVALIEDSKTGTVVKQVEGVKISEQSFSVTARGVVSENVSMVAKRVRDASDLT